MSEQFNQNPTPTVQVNEVGLPQQASAGKVLLVAGAVAGVAAALASLLSEKEEIPASNTESAKAYLRNALENAQQQDIAKGTRKQRKQAEKAVKKQQKKMSKETGKIVKQGREVASHSATAVRDEVSSLMDSIRSGNIEVDRVVEGFAESQLMARLREFGEEAKSIADQGKMRSENVAKRVQKDVVPQARKAADDATHKVQDELIPQAKKAAGNAAHKVQDELLPQAKKAAEEATRTGKEKLDEVAERARKDFIPEAQKQTADFASAARETAEHLGDDAEKFLSEASDKAEKKRKEATKAVQRGGRETRSLLLWVSLAGILIFTVFLDEEQQEKLKEVVFEVFGEARDMYSDMKGNTAA